MAQLLEEPLAALISSSARHSAMVLMLRKAASRAPVHRSQIAWLTLLRGDTSTACLLTVPVRPILVESSRGPELMTALTRIWRGFSPVMRLFTRRSTTGHWALRNLLAANLPAE